MVSSLPSQFFMPFGFAPLYCSRTVAPNWSFCRKMLLPSPHPSLTVAVPETVVFVMDTSAGQHPSWLMESEFHWELSMSTARPQWLTTENLPALLMSDTSSVRLVLVAVKETSLVVSATPLPSPTSEM